MSIEIRQLVVKSNVLQRCGSGDQGGEAPSEESRQELLEEMRGMIAEALRKSKER